MKTFQYSRFAVTILIAVFAISLSNCSVHTRTGSSSKTGSSSRTMFKSKPLPPGHAKKIHGQKSAKRFAPGHNK